MRNGVWMRVCDADGIEQSSVMVLGDYMFWMHSFEDGKPLLIDYEHTPGEGTRNAFEICELARKLRVPASEKHFAAGGTHLLLTAGVSA